MNEMDRGYEKKHVANQSAAESWALGQSEIWPTNRRSAPPMTLMPIHVAAGAVGIIIGFLALYALKGAWLHRKAGMLLRGFLMRRSSRPDPAIQV